ncbi:MAG: 5,10-methylenetetrahydrofolate reductase [Actinobacteria bacterium]|nr:5,10-methylenetetrahydrofolate reductase [Actinomycetota bacterium]
MTSRPTISLEFFPPKDEAGEERLWSAVGELQSLKPDFIAVTYGAGGSTRERTVRIATEITARSGVPTLAHLTCVGSTEEQLRSVLKRYQDSGIHSVLALRGDPQGGPRSEWVTTPGGFDHADQLVSLAVSMGFEVGVAAFPDGHPASDGDFDRDLQVLLEKEKRGASFAVTQFFFEAERYFALRDKLKALGSSMDIYPGVLPITNVKQLRRMAELGGTPIPSSIEDRISQLADDADLVRKEGIEIAFELSRSLLDGGVPGLHFYTLNSAHSTIEVVKRLGIR